MENIVATRAVCLSPKCQSYYSLAAIGLSPSKKSSEMPAQAANGSSSNPASPLGQGGVVESNSDDKFLFTSESVGEGHPGELTAKVY